METIRRFFNLRPIRINPEISANLTVQALTERPVLEDLSMNTRPVIFSPINVENRTIRRIIIASFEESQRPKLKPLRQFWKYIETSEPPCEETICTICQSPRTNVKIKCKHCDNVYFHRRCIIRWFANQNRCPNCNKQMI